MPKREFHRSRSHDILIVYGLYPATWPEPYYQPAAPSYDFSQGYNGDNIWPSAESKPLGPPPIPPLVEKTEPPLATGVIDLPPLINSQVVWLEPLGVADKKEEAVYITRTDERYHRHSCQHLRRSRLSLCLCGERITQKTFFSVGSGTGPAIVAPVRVTVSTILRAELSITWWS
jgi:hypothetical protein